MFAGTDRETIVMQAWCEIFHKGGATYSEALVIIEELRRRIEERMRLMENDN